MEESHAPPERRSQPRYAVDADATLLIVSHDARIRGRLFELSLDGCRVRADRRCSVSTPAAIELTFKINGIAFRLAGTMQWIDSQLAAGIQFAAMAQRRLEALMDLLAELEAEEQAKAAKALMDGAGESGQEVNPGGDEAQNANLQLTSAGGRTIEARPSVAAERRLESAEARLQTLPGRRAEGSVANPGPTLKPAPAGAVAHAPAPVAPASDPAVQIPASKPHGRERRAEMRHAVDTRATIFFIDVRAEISGRILDLSMTGGRIRTDERFPVGIYRRVETEFKLDGLPFRLPGVVQSLHDKFTVGIRFLDVSSRKRDQLAQLMDEIEEMKTRDQGLGTGTTEPGTDQGPGVGSAESPSGALAL